jgi:hypothetical protein
MSVMSKIKANLRKFLPKSMRKGHALGKRYGHSKRRHHR